MSEPDPLRDAIISARALRDAAATLPASEGFAARLLIDRANRLLVATRNGYLAADAATALQAEGRWVRKPYKSGPERTMGPAHITSPELPASTADQRQVVMCRTGTVSGRGLEFGPVVRGDEGAPPGWRQCVPCMLALGRTRRTPAEAVTA